MDCPFTVGIQFQREGDNIKLNPEAMMVDLSPAYAEHGPNELWK